MCEKSYQPFGGRQGGGGAPNRTESGRVAAGFRADPELRFPRHASKANVEPVLVSMAGPQIYLAPPYRSLYSGIMLRVLYWAVNTRNLQVKFC